MKTCSDRPSDAVMMVCQRQMPVLKGCKHICLRLEEAHHLAVNATFIPTGGSGTEPTKVGTALCAIFGSLKG